VIRVPNLPAAGFAASNDHSTWLVDLEGQVVERLRGFVVAGNTGNEGVWLQKGRDYYQLGPRGLEFVDREVARGLIYEEGAAPDLEPPPGSRVQGRVAGHWRYAFEGPSGVLLAQWSGECESPNAFWIEPDEDPVLVTGGKKVAAGPESIALGWVGDTAYAYLGLGMCGSAGDPPGIYGFNSPGAGNLIYATRGRVDMWD
jgi:hypothetical protein